MRGQLAYRALTCLVVTLLAIATGQSPRSPAANCSFRLLNSKVLVDNIVQYLDKESYTVILEYYLNFTNVSSGFDLQSRASPAAFQPWRWFRCQGLATSQLLLIYNYYYGLLKPLMAIGINEIKVDLAVSPSDCLNSIGKEELEPLLRDYLLQDFNIESKTSKHSFKYSDDVEMCTARISNNAGWGRLLYRCCGYDADNLLYCHDVFEDGWIWALRVFIVVLTVCLCLYMPVLIPRGYRVDRYTYEAKEDLRFKIVVTKNTQKYSDFESAAIIPSRHLTSMKSFREKVDTLKLDSITTVSVDKLDLSISEEKIFVESGQTIKMMRALFNAFIRCKIQHLGPVKDCCNTPACGTHCCHCCPRWSAWLRAIRTVLVLSILALPCAPFMYAMCADGLDYQVLSKAFKEKGLKSYFDLYTGPIAGKVIVGFVGSMYVLHGIIVVIDGTSQGSINKLYTEVLNEDGKKERVRRRLEVGQKIIKKACWPVKRYGVIFIPFWILLLLLSPLVFILLFVINSPMVQVIKEVLKRLIMRARMLKDNPQSALRLYNRCEMLLFFFTSIFVVVILTFGANFIVHVLVLTIVMIVVEAELMYRILPVVFILIIYIRDSYSTIGKKFDAFLTTVFTYVTNKKLEDMRKEAFKPWQVQENKIYQIPPDVEFENYTGDATVVNLTPEGKEAKSLELPPLFDLKDGELRFKMKQFLVFLDKDDNMYISKKFLFHCSNIDCAGAPGTLGENYLDATMEFFKIGVFILFIFLVIMAYGTIYYISPTNHLFITLITGLIPLIIKNLFSGGSAIQTVNTSNFRFQAQFKEKVETFHQSWAVDDIVLKHPPSDDSVDHAEENEEFTVTKNNIDLLVVSVNDDFNQTLPVVTKSRNQDGSRFQGPAVSGQVDERPLLAAGQITTTVERDAGLTAMPPERQTKVRTILADVGVPRSKSSQSDGHETKV